MTASAPLITEEADDQPVQVAPAHRNSVRLVGRVSGVPVERELPSGDRLVTFRLVIERTAAAGSARRPGARVDTIDCAAWGARVRRSALGWSPGEVVEVEGAMRRRFRRAPGGGPISRVEVEVLKARRHH